MEMGTTAKGSYSTSGNAANQGSAIRSSKAVNGRSSEDSEGFRHARKSPKPVKGREGYAGVVKGTPQITGFFAAQSNPIETSNQFQPLTDRMDES